MINWYIAAGIAGTCLVLPFLAFYCVKMGAYGYYMARQLYLKENERKDDGE